MDTAAKRGSPRTITSKRTITYRESAWRVYEIEVWKGEMVCRVATLRMPDSLLVWVGAGEARLAHAALGLPAPAAGCAALLGAGGPHDAAPALARRLAAALRCPVHVCCGASYDRFTLPLVERALLDHLRSLPPSS